MNTSQFFGGWDENASFRELWEREFSCFPESIPGTPGQKAFGMQKTNLETELMIQTENLTWLYPHERVKYCSEQVAYLLQTLKKEGKEINGTISELQHLTLDFEQREKLNIPTNADMFCWANPIQQTESINNEKLFFSNLGMHDSDVQFLLFGGFMYFKKNELIRCNCIVPSDESGLIFGPPNSFSCLRWHCDFLTKIKHRLSLITIKSLRDTGATQFCWILPGELKGCPHGGFLYIFEASPDKNRYFGLVGTTVNADSFRRNWEEATEEKHAREGYEALFEIIYSGGEKPDKKEDIPRNSAERTWELPEFPESLPGSGSISFEAKPTVLADSMHVNVTEGKWVHLSHNVNFSGTISRRHPVTIAAKHRVPVNIPSNASYFCWANPANEIRETNPSTESQAEKKLSESSDGQTSEPAEIQTERELTAEDKFFHFGGFMYFNNVGDLIACNCIVPSNNPGFLFGPPKLLDSHSKVQKKFLEELVEKKQFNNITLPHLLAAGAKQFCWLLPEEIKGCSFGGFLYIFENTAMNRYFSLMAVGDAKDSKACWDKEIAEINASEDFKKRFKDLKKKAAEMAKGAMLRQIFLCAAKTGQMDLIELLIAKTDVKTKGDALIEAASKGHTEVCDTLLAFRPDQFKGNASLEAASEENTHSGNRDEKGKAVPQYATENEFWEYCVCLALQHATEHGFWETCLLLYREAREDEKEQILVELLPGRKKKLLKHAYFEKDERHWKEIYDLLLRHGKNSLLDETSILEPWFVQTSLSLLKNKQKTNLTRLNFKPEEKNIILKWEVQNGIREKKHQEACQILIEEGADFASVLKVLVGNGLQLQESHKKAEVVEGERELSDRESGNAACAGVWERDVLEKVEYLMEAVAKSFVKIDLEFKTVQDFFTLYQNKDVHEFLKAAPYTSLILFLSDSFFPKDYETSKAIPPKLTMLKISKAIHTKVVNLCDDSPSPIFFLIKVAAALAKRGEERTIHQGEYLLVRNHFVDIARDAMKIDEFNNIDNTFQALGGEAGELLSFLKEEKPINYAMRYNLNEIICSPHVQELLQIVWGIPRLWDALSPFEFEWSKSISTHLTLQDKWSFETYRKIPCLRALVGAFFKFLFLGLCYIALFSEDLGVQRRLSLVFMVMAIGYSVENYYQGKVDGKKRKSLMFLLIFVWTWMIWADHPSIKYCNIIMAVTCAVIALYSLEFLKYFETFGFMMVAFTEIWQDFEIFAIFYLFFLFSFAILFTFTDTEIEEFKDLHTSLISLVSGSFGNFDLAIFYAESSHWTALHTFGQVLFVVYLFVVYVILLNLLTALLTVTFTRNQDKKTEKFFLLKANFVRNFASLDEDNRGLGDKLLPPPLCIFNLLLDHQKYPWCWLSGAVLFVFDFVITVIVVIPWCWVLVVFLILNRLDECTAKIKKMFSFDSCASEGSKKPVHRCVEILLVYMVYFCCVFSSPLWFPFVVIARALQNDPRLKWDWNPRRKCVVYKHLDEKGTEPVNSNDNNAQNWKPFLRERMKNLLEIFQTKTEKGEGLYWISKEINRDGLLRDIKDNHVKILQEQAKMFEEIKDKIDKMDKRLGNLELNLSQNRNTKKRSASLGV